MEIKGVLAVKCNKCSHEMHISADEADFDVFSSSERPMGMEHGYGWDHRFHCEKCPNYIEIEYQVWEYPPGAFNNDDATNITGGEITSKFDYDFQGDIEEDLWT